MSETSSRVEREEFAAGDVLVRFPSAEIPRLLILSPIAKPGWHGRAEGTATRPLFPGSAVLFEDAYYEVRRIETPPASGTSNQRAPAYRYELWAWEDRFPIREAFDYTREECVRVEAAVRAALRKQAAAHTLAWLMPFTGLLPARLQLAIEAEYGLPAARATFWSAAILFALGFVASLVGFQAALSMMMAGPRPGPVSLFAMHWLPLSFYLVVESIVRCRLSFPAGVVMGSAPIALPVLVGLALRDAFAQRPTIRVDEPESEIRGAVTAAAVDRVADLPDGRLEIRSLLPKPHWGMRSAIHYRDAWWMLDERATLPSGVQIAGAGAPVVWRFILSPWPEHMLVQDPQEYSPEEVRGLAYDAARDRHRATVETLGPLLGLLPPSVQERLAEAYGYDPRSRTAASLLLVAGSSLFALAVAAARLLQHTGTAADAVAAIAAVLLLLETAARTRRWLRGEITGSALSILVRPLARRVLDLGPPA